MEAGCTGRLPTCWRYYPEMVSVVADMEKLRRFWEGRSNEREMEDDVKQVVVLFDKVIGTASPLQAAKYDAQVKNGLDRIGKRVQEVVVGLRTMAASMCGVSDGEGRVSKVGEMEKRKSQWLCESDGTGSSDSGEDEDGVGSIRGEGTRGKKRRHVWSS